VFGVQKRVLGIGHHYTLLAMIDLARVTKKRGRLGEAIALMEERFRRLQKTYGRDYPHTLMSLRDLHDWKESKGSDGNEIHNRKEDGEGDNSQHGHNHGEEGEVEGSSSA
jgi:hypothetical protein